MDYSFDWGSLVRGWPLILDGMAMTALLVSVGMTLGISAGVLLALARLYGPRWLAVAAAFYVNLFRSIPLILTIFWFFFLVPFVLRAITGNPYAGVGPIYAALAAFVLAEAAYYCEIIRAGILSVRNGQMHAATALGLNRWQALRYVILPQAIRNMTPSLINQTIALLKDTSLVYVISLNDFLGAATKVAHRDGTLVEMYLFVAAVYLAVCSLGVWLVTKLKKNQVAY
ncbi:amino acid ABC transporter permease [Pollutimonas nitritireducens]|uniref:Glutamate/aspartate import permease protein GltK n=1 Tax=Pollutimonas nitritireducens TaxID=2045209 RepID=A0A2N4UHZ3_9BURK|nr:amino acid ABC transporter permease [Pollutimonas nitritireducens]PLC54646.1 amino acid ABC transporter permease [Pollutimonas nitritireducens]